MPADIYIELNDLCIGFVSGKKTKPVFQHLNAVFESGSFVGIIGNNGMGKSTLIRTICGMQPALAGKVICDGKSLNHVTKPELAKMLAVVLTERVGGFNLTVYDFLSSGRAPYTNAFHVLSDKDEAEILRAIHQTGLNEYMHVRLDELSDGLYQKAAIAKALAQNTRALTLDEPSSFLDFSSRHTLFKELKQLSENEHKCILASSHDLDLVLSYCTHLFILASENRYAFIKTEESLSNNLFQEITKGYFQKD